MLSASAEMQVHLLLIDLGNTSAKIRLATADRLIGTTRRLTTNELLGRGGKGALREALGDWRYERMVMSSVVPAAARTVEQTLKRVESVSPLTEAGVDFRAYPGRKTLGADRIANMAGALALYGPGPLIVVDFGTAATFNALDARGRFLGGVIAPGWGAFSGYLPSRAAQLPTVRFTGAAPRAIGKTTVNAIRAGTLIGYRGMLREILGKMREELGDDARVVATGGDASFLAARGWGLFDVIDPDLTLHGLHVIACRSLITDD